MDHHQIEFSPEKSQERINRALQIFPQKLLMRILAFALHLQGTKRKDIAKLVGMPDESVKTFLRLVSRDGFFALRDRRTSATSSVAVSPPSLPHPCVHRDQDEWIINFGIHDKTLSIPSTHSVQARTVILSLLNAKALSAQECATALGISVAHCRELARKLADRDVAQSLLDKREGQRTNYRVGPEQKVEIIRQWVARIVTGHSTSSDVLTKQVNERTQSRLSARTVRWHIRELGLVNIQDTLPQLISSLKKTPTHCC